MENKTNITREILEQMLPDYALGKLSAEDKDIFEQNIPAYPDLEKELDSFRIMFSRMENVDFDSPLEERTRNISVKVNERLAEKRSKKKAGVILKYISPVAAMLVITIGIFLLTPGNDNQNINSNKNIADQEAQDDIEIPSIESNKLLPSPKPENPVSNEIKKEVAKNVNPKRSQISEKSDQSSQDVDIVTNSPFEILEFYLSSELENDIDIYFSEVLNDFIREDVNHLKRNDIEGLFDKSEIFTISELQEIETLTEEEFKILIKVIENEDFES